MIQGINQAAELLRSRTSLQPEIGLILGSGLGHLVDSMEVESSVAYNEIPGAPVSTIQGHSGKCVFGRLAGRSLAVLQGRVHFYEGYSMEQVTFLSRVLGRVGIRKLIVTNAAGGMNHEFEAGDLMLISDHLNMMGVNPLRGANVEELGVRFPDVSEPYSAEMRAVAHRVASREGIALREGVYVAMPGPSFETPAEIRAMRLLGGDAVGMSTVPEVVAMAHMGIPVLGISCITNMAAGILPQKLSHQEVIETTSRVGATFVRLISAVIRDL